MSHLSKPKPGNLKSPKPLNISYINIRGLRSNFKDLQAYMCNNRSDLFTLCILDADFLHQNTCQCIARISHTWMVLACMFEIAFLLLVTLEDINEPFRCFRLALLHSTTYILPLPFTIVTVLLCDGRCVQQHREGSDTSPFCKYHLLW